MIFRHIRQEMIDKKQESKNWKIGEKTLYTKFLKYLTVNLLLFFLFTNVCLGQEDSLAIKVDSAFIMVKDTVKLEQNDSVYVKRKFITSILFQNHAPLTNKQAKSIFKDYKQPTIKCKWSKILIPAGVVSTVSGFGLAYIALKGKVKQVDYVGTILTYTDRSLSKLIIGLGCVVVGVSFIESGNELIANAAKIYNIESKKKNMSQNFDKELKIGLTSSGGLGFQLKF